MSEAKSQRERSRKGRGMFQWAGCWTLDAGRGGEGDGLCMYTLRSTPYFVRCTP